jgi:pyridoxal phosphate enzyme (YggS family)
MPGLNNSIADNLKLIHAEIRSAETLYHRPLNSVTLLAISKNQPAAAIEEAFTAGQHAFGENYLQEALEKMQLLSHHPIEWHYTGSIQSNKTKKLAENFHWVHTVSDFKMAQRLNNQRPEKLPHLNICLQVNSSLEASKSGAHPDKILELAQLCSELPRLKLRGLMAIPAEKNILADQRAECRKVSEIWKNLGEKGIKIDTLSLGMSNDLAAAIAEGSTLVRIGTKIFGNRLAT